MGIGPTKTLSKLTNHVAKKHPNSKGVFDYNRLDARQQASVLAHLAAGEIWGIGRKLTRALNANGIETALQLRGADVASMRGKHGVVMEKTIRELRGEPCIEIEEVAPAKQQIISSRSFGQAVTDIADLQDAIAHFITNAALKLRNQNSIAGLLQVCIMTDCFREDRPQYNPSVTLALPVSTDDTLTLNQWACKGLETIYKVGYQYKKAGVILGEITHKSIRQTDLFEYAPLEPELMQTMDNLNTRFGKGTLRLSQDGSRRAWVMRQDRKSPDYTTNWNELAECR